MTKGDRYRILVLNNVRSPSFDPLFSCLSRHSDWDLKVCYVSGRTDDVGWPSLEGPPSYPVIILSDFGRPRFVAVAQLLVKEKPDYLLVYGYAPGAQMAAIVFAVLFGIAFGVIGDANVHCDRVTGLVRAAKWAWLKFVARAASDIFAVGTAGRLFWERYRVRPEKLHVAPYAVDNDFFAPGAAADLANRAARRNAPLRLIFVGRLIRRKNVSLILDALRALPPHTVSLMVAGEGPERVALERLAADVPQEIRFLGRVEHRDLPRRYGESDALILAAGLEPWGLVVNEAMASGLAIIAHEHVGAVADLVSDCNGVVLHSFDAAELAGAIRLLTSEERLLAMKGASMDRVASWNVETAAGAITGAIHATLVTRVGSGASMSGNEL